MRPFSFEAAAKIAAGSIGIEETFGAGVAWPPAASPGGVDIPFCVTAGLTTNSERIKIGPSRGLTAIGVSYPNVSARIHFFPGLSFHNFISCDLYSPYLAGFPEHQEPNICIIGVDYHLSFQQNACLVEEIASPGLLEARDILGAIRYIRSGRNSEPIAVLGLSYGAAVSLIAAAQSPDIVAVVSDGAFPTGEQLSQDIGRHYLDDPSTPFWVRIPLPLSSAPGGAGAMALVYYARSGIYLGSELLSVIPPA